MLRISPCELTSFTDWLALSMMSFRSLPVFCGKKPNILVSGERVSGMGRAVTMLPFFSKLTLLVGLVKFYGIIQN